jgi:hypothetical protein
MPMRRRPPMIQARAPRAGVAGTLPRGRPRTAWRDDLLTVLLAAWTTVGLFLDGWAHTNPSELETFLTPWHAVFYSGFAATATWIPGSWNAITCQDEAGGRPSRTGTALESSG